MGASRVRSAGPRSRGGMQTCRPAGEPRRSDVSEIRRPAVREKRYPVKHVAGSKNIRFPLGETAYLPRDVEETARRTSKTEPRFITDFWGDQIEDLRLKAA